MGNSNIGQGALSGLRVLDLSQRLAVPSASMYLAQQGADVIRIQAPRGDAGTFTMAPFPGDDRARYVQSIHRNKRDIAVDLTTEEGRKILHSLVKTADIFLHNYRSKVHKKLGIEYETLRKINPRIIYLNLTPFGSKGPWSIQDKPGYDRVIQAVSGIHGIRNLPDGTPVAAGIWAADSSTPWLIDFGITMALYVREKTGVGQQVETSLLAGALAMQVSELVTMESEIQNNVQPTSFRDQATWAPYVCSDKNWLISIIVSDKEFLRLCKALGIEHVAADTDFDGPLKRAENSTALHEILAGIFAEKSRDEWIRILEQNDVPCAPILTPLEAMDFSQAIENELIIKVDHPKLGMLRMIGPGVRLSQNPPVAAKVAPRLGEHTDEILRELGYTATDVSQMRQKGIIR